MIINKRDALRKKYFLKQEFEKKRAFIDVNQLKNDLLAEKREIAKERRSTINVHKTLSKDYNSNGMLHISLFTIKIMRCSAFNKEY